MAEWLHEAGIGEDRAALVKDGAILETAIELPGVRAGAVIDGRLITILVPHKRGMVALNDGGEALLEPLPRSISEGAAVRVEIVREAIAEAGRDKLPRCRATAAPAAPGPGLRERIEASGEKLRSLASHEPDLLEACGWGELLEEARTGAIAFPGGALTMSLTPAMTLFDVDGAPGPVELAIAGAAAAGGAIRRHGISGSIGIDLPTMPRKEDRLAAAAALDAALPPPFERTAVNGFGFLQIVRRRMRPSLPELIQYDALGAAARALLRRAERAGGAGDRMIEAAPAVIARLEAQPGWLDELARRTGGRVVLRADAARTIFAGHVQLHRS